MEHIHAAAMAEYAKDALETDRPWERWEFCHMRGEYQSLHGHPSFDFWQRSIAAQAKQGEQA